MKISKIKDTLLTSLIFWVWFSLTVITVFYVYAWTALDTNMITPSDELMADSWSVLTADRWNALVQRVSNIYTSTWGNVGIGTTSPWEKLTIDRSNSNGALLRLEHIQWNIWDYGSIDFARWYNSWNQETVSLRAIAAWGQLDHFAIFTNGWIGTEPTERMRISTSGNVGIGLTNPNAKLHIKSDIQLVTIWESNDGKCYLKLVNGACPAQYTSMLNDDGKTLCVDCD